MMKFAALSLALMSSAAMAVSAPAVNNGSFESNLTNSGTYLYAADAASLGLGLPTVSVGQQPATGWSFSGTAGVSENARAWSTSRMAEDGGAYAFVQTFRNATGVLSQTLNLASGVNSLDISFWTVQRNMGINARQVLDVALTDSAGTVLKSITVNPDSDWAKSTLSLSALAAGQYTLKFRGAGALGSDRSAFIDNVSMSSITAVPEPDSSWLALAGVGVAGVVLARRRHQA